jgi:flagellar FliJ protein
MTEARNATLAVLARLRRLAADQARRGLAAALEHERAAGEAQAAAVAALRREAQAAPRDAADPLSGRFALWLPSGQAALRDTASRHALAASQVDQARQALAAARAAIRAVEHVSDARAAAARAARQRAAQAALDDFASGMRAGAPD